MHQGNATSYRHICPVVTQIFSGLLRKNGRIARTCGSTLILYLIMLVLALPTRAQRTMPWHFDDEITLRQMCNVYMDANYPLLYNRNPKKIEQCFAENIVASFPDRTSFLALTGSEMARIEAERSCECMTKVMTPIIREVADRLTPENLVGRWIDGKSDFYLRPDGTTTITIDPWRQPKTGTWTLENDHLVLRLSQRIFGKKFRTYTILAFYNNTFLYYRFGEDLYCVYRSDKQYNE
jgi:hypothetical protein